MAEKEEKTEQPTGKRKAEARNKGTVAKSQDFSAAVMLLAGALLIWFIGGYMGGWLRDTMKETLMSISQVELTKSNFVYFARSSAKLIFVVLGPFLAVIAVIAVIVNGLQTDWLFTLYPIKPKFDKVFGLDGFKKLFGVEQLVNMLKSIFKMIVVGLVGYNVISSHYTEYLYLVDQTVGEIVLLLFRVLVELMIKCAILLIILGIIDYFWVRYKTNKGMKMTKQEIKDEMKSAEGDPKIKARLRGLRMEMHRKFMMQEVEKATVVVTNPTYIAIAIKYVQGEDDAPIVVAKGKRLVAEKIKKIAKEHEVPIVENKPLARGMYDFVEPGQKIPEEFFAPIAEVLAYVYSLQKQGASYAAA